MAQLLPHKKYYLFDSSAALHYYLASPELPFKRSLAFLMATRLAGKSLFYIPEFCIAETFNIFARYHYRDKELTAADHDRVRKEFSLHVRNRATFYPLELTRYHNYNIDAIAPIEHTTSTEYQAANLLAPISNKKLKKGLATVGADKNPGRYRLSTFDMLIISMGIELEKVHGKNTVAIITNDKRLALISNACARIHCPRAFYMNETKVEDIQTFHGNTGEPNSSPTAIPAPPLRRRPPSHQKADLI